MATLQDILGGGLPAGLLSPEQEAIAQQRAQNAGLLNLAFGLLQASRGTPGQGRPGLGQIIGQAGPVGVQAYQQSFDDTLKRTLQSMQIADAQRKRQEEESGRAAMRSLSERLMGTTPQAALAAPGGQVGPTPERAAMIGERQPITSDELIRMAFAPGLGVEQQKTILAAAELTKPKPTELPSSYREYVLATQDPVNPYKGSYVQYQQDLRKAGATNVSVSTEKSYGGALAGKVAEQDAAKFDAANAAPNVIQTIQSTRNLLDSGNVITGIGAQQRLDLARFGQLLGVGGKDANERIANTQQLFSNRAQATLDSIRSSGLGSGQGFSNKDREFLENARLGNITYSPEALRRQLDIEERVARATVTSWNNRIKNIPQDARQALGLSTVELPAPAITTPTPNKPPLGVPKELWDVMTPEEKKLWQK